MSDADKAAANSLVDAFAADEKSPSVWAHMDRAEVAAGLKIRIDKPDKIDQGHTSLCGPADFARDIAEDDPEAYAKAVIDLFKTGTALIGTLRITAGNDLRKYSLTQGTDPADWILLASIRDMDNWWFDYQAENDRVSAMTLPHSKVSWLKSAGYTEVIDDTNVARNKDKANATRASDLFDQGYKVALFINSQMLYADKMNNSSAIPNHWVALTTSIDFSSEKVKFEVYTWGDRRQVPKTGDLTLANFLKNYYGFVACRR